METTSGSPVLEEYIDEQFIQEGILLKDDPDDTWFDARSIVQDDCLDKAPYRWVCAIEKILEVGTKKATQTKRSLGTGFLLKGERIILTAGHNLESTDKRKYKVSKILISFPYIREKKCTIEDLECETLVYSKLDIGAIRLSAENPFGIGTKEGFEPWTFPSSRLRRNEALLICGFPAPRNLKASMTKSDQEKKQANPHKPVSGEKTLQLYLENKKTDWPVLVEGMGIVHTVDGDDETFEHKVDTEAGNSGSPVLRWSNGEWRVVGVHVAGDDDRKYNYAVLLTKNNLDKLDRWRKKSNIDEPWKLTNNRRKDEAIPFNDQAARGFGPDRFGDGSGDGGGDGVRSGTFDAPPSIPGTQSEDRRSGSPSLSEDETLRSGGSAGWSSVDTDSTFGGTEANARTGNSVSGRTFNAKSTSTVHDLRGATIGTNAPVENIGVIYGDYTVGGGVAGSGGGAGSTDSSQKKQQEQQQPRDTQCPKQKFLHWKNDECRRRHAYQRRHASLIFPENSYFSIFSFYVSLFVPVFHNTTKLIFQNEMNNIYIFIK